MTITITLDMWITLWTVLLILDVALIVTVGALILATNPIMRKRFNDWIRGNDDEQE